MAHIGPTGPPFRIVLHEEGQLETALSQCCEHPVHVTEVELLGIEFTTDPFEHTLVLRVGWRRHSIKEFGIAERVNPF